MAASWRASAPWLRWYAAASWAYWASWPRRGVTAAVWGVVQVVNAQRSIALLDSHIAELVAEQKRLKQQLEEE